MPRFVQTPTLQHWIFTITFKGTLTCKQKYRKIDLIPDVFSKFVNFKVNDMIEVKYSIEYHKIKGGPFDGDDNATAPHVHGFLICKKLSQASAKLIYDHFKDNYGFKVQFYLVENPIQIQQWDDYMMKDVIRLKEKYNCEHFFIHTITQPSKGNIFEEEDDEYDVEGYNL